MYMYIYYIHIIIYSLLVSCRSEEMRSDPSLVLAAIPQSGFVLGFAAEELRQAKAFVLQAVKLNGYALIGTGAQPRGAR